MIDYTGRVFRYEFGNFDFGGGADASFYVRGPLGKAALLYDYGVYAVTEAFAAGTATPMMKIGNGDDDDAYGAAFDFGALAVASGGKSLRSSYRPGTDAGWASHMVDREIPADTPVKVGCVAGTGAGLAGQAIPFVDIIWAL